MGVKVLSLFDGMACGMLAMINANLKVDEYIAYEIDKYAIQTAIHNFPMIQECGDVFKGDYTKYKDFDYLIGGSPCFTAGHLILTDTGYKDISEIQIGDMVLTHMNRYRSVTRLYQHQSETVKLKIMGCPEFTVTENHPFLARIKSKTGKFSESEWVRVGDMNTNTYCAIHLHIAEKEMIHAENFYIDNNIFWTPFKSMAKTGRSETVYNIEVEEDHSYTVNNCIVHNCTYWSIAQSPDRRETTASGIGWELFSQYVRALNEVKPKFFIYENNSSMSVEVRKCICTTFGFSPIEINSSLVSAQNRKRLYWVGMRNKDNGYDKVYVDNPLNKRIVLKNILDSVGIVDRNIHRDSLPNSQRILSDGAKQVGALPRPNGELSTSQALRVYSIDGKSINLLSNGGGAGGKTGLYAIPIMINNNEIPNTINETDGKMYTVYKVKNNYITIKGRQYPIKLSDGYYIIRKLSVNECKRLQTVPEWYEFPVSDAQAYKMLGNGWTVDVITHLINSTLDAESTKHLVTNNFDIDTLKYINQEKSVPKKLF